MKKNLLVFLLLLLIAAVLLLAGCGDPSADLPEEGTAAETAAETTAETTAGNGAGMGTESSAETTAETAAETTAETAAETAAETEPDVRSMWGIVVEYTGEEPMDHVFAIEAWVGSERTTLYVYYDDPAMDACVGDEVIFTYNANAEVMDSYDGVPVLVALTMEFAPIAVPEKPVIYLYPEVPTEVSVKLTVDGSLTCTYPAYDKGWDNFVAHPDGTLVFPDGKQYYCLYWEGIQNMDCDFSEGFCVKGSDTASFLEWALAGQGLTPREANEFIIYWLPRMEGNPYNVISFQTEAYTEGAVLEIAPNPDSLLRVFMAWYPSDGAVEMVAQEFEGFDRAGFAVVEWGGCEVARP